MLTLTSIVLFTLGAYGVAAGAARASRRVVAVGVFAFALFVVGIVWPIVALRGVECRRRRPARRDRRRPHHAARCSITGASSRVEVRLLDPPGEWWRTRRARRRRARARRGAARRVPRRAGRAAHGGAARRVRAPPHVVGRAARCRSRSARARSPMRYEPPALPDRRWRPRSAAPARRRAATPCARCGRTCPATRRGSCTGRRARAAASSSCASTSRPPIVGVALVVDLRGAATSAESRGEPRRRASAAPRCAPARRAGAARARRRAGRRAGRRRPRELGRRLARATTGAPPPAPDRLADGRRSRRMTAERVTQSPRRVAPLDVGMGRGRVRGRARRRRARSPRAGTGHSVVVGAGARRGRGAARRARAAVAADPHRPRR